ncbi:hypothetical protein ACFFVB_04925 [Formosa undariae]|uniref:Beta-lactamase-inhibitor-like PepSY-like domain-containing protein n=1 Tax=Formosa undariae TaxID=1325436 RepID=A0ABV5EZ06_9FLAO
MKNIVIASALALGGISTYATTPQTMFFHDGIMDVVFQEDFTPIEINQLPGAILDEVVKHHGEVEISKAYRNDLREYKLELNLDNSIITVFKDENGHWINK